MCLMERNSSGAKFGSEREPSGRSIGFFIYEREEYVKKVIAKEQKRKK